MLVIKSIKLEALGGSGITLGENGTEENWTATYKICTNGCAVDPRCLIIAAINADTEDPETEIVGDSFPNLGTAWPPNQDGISTFSECGASRAVADSISPGEAIKTGCECCYTFEVGYSIPTGDAGPDPTNPDADPLDPITFCPRLEPYTLEEEEIVEHAEFKGIYQAVDDDSAACNECPSDEANEDLFPVQNCAVTLTPGSCTAIMNSAGQRIEPLPTRIKRLKGYRVTYNLPTYDADLYTCYEGAINCEQFILQVPCLLFSKTFAPMTAMLVAVSGRQASFNANGVNINYWEVTFDILEDRRGFCIDYQNRGTQVTNCEGDPDFHNGVVAGADPADPGYVQGVSQQPSEFAGVPATRPVRDQDGFTSNEPVPLDGAGMAVRDGSRYYLRYCPDPCRDLSEVIP